VLIADDHAAVRAALAELIGARAGLDLVAAAGDAVEAVELAERTHPDVALLDVQMPLGGGVGAARGIAERSPRTRMVFYSATTDTDQLELTGVVRFLPKGSPIDQIVSAVEAAALEVPPP
jgi:DNA-binding NarL/FixJ family response regulator